jgi:hypothetical protein
MHILCKNLWCLTNYFNLHDGTAYGWFWGILCCKNIHTLLSNLTALIAEYFN